MSFLNSKKGLFVLGIATGLVVVMLAAYGNPKNMAICVACFIRDMAGSMRWHNAAVVQYFRPEITGIVAGAFLVSLFTGEYKATSSSSSCQMRSRRRKPSSSSVPGYCRRRAGIRCMMYRSFRRCIGRNAACRTSTSCCRKR